MGRDRRLVRPARRTLLVLTVLGLGLALAGCATHPQSAIDAAGPVAERQLDLFNLTTLLAAIVGVCVAALMGFILVRFRDRGQGGRVPQVRGHRWLQIVWTIIPLLIVLYKAVPTVAESFHLAETPPGALHVRVIGHQWWWEFQYPDLDIVTANELVIPVDRPVALTITSNDVIHSLWVPRLAGKIDAIPGRQNTYWFQASEAGEFYGQCAELCGTSHANMRLRVVARPVAEFETWAQRMAELAAHPVTPSDPQALAGRDLFLSGKACFSCHSIAGTRAQGTFGPNLTGLAGRGTLAAGMLSNTPEELARWIRDPAAVKPGVKMPAIQMTEAEREQIVAYLRSQK